MNTAMYVVLIVVGVLAVLALVWVPIIVWLRRRARAAAGRLATEIEGETVVLAPERGSYRGATAPGYPVVKNAGLIAQTAAGELGFYVFSGTAGWIAALSAATPGRPTSP